MASGKAEQARKVSYKASVTVIFKPLLGLFLRLLSLSNKSRLQIQLNNPFVVLRRQIFLLPYFIQNGQLVVAVDVFRIIFNGLQESFFRLSVISVWPGVSLSLMPLAINGNGLSGISSIALSILLSKSVIRNIDWIMPAICAS